VGGEKAAEPGRSSLLASWRPDMSRRCAGRLAEAVSTTHGRRPLGEPSKQAIIKRALRSRGGSLIRSGHARRLRRSCAQVAPPCG